MFHLAECWMHAAKRANVQTSKPHWRIAERIANFHFFFFPLSFFPLREESRISVYRTFKIRQDTRNGGTREIATLELCHIYIYTLQLTRVRSRCGTLSLQRMSPACVRFTASLTVSMYLDLLGEWSVNLRAKDAEFPCKHQIHAVNVRDREMPESFAGNRRFPLQPGWLEVSRVFSKLLFLRVLN
jgi:hypothetical protein